MNLRWKAFEKSLVARVKPYDARRQMTFWQRLGHFFFNILSTASSSKLRGASTLFLTLLRGGLSLGAISAVAVLLFASRNLVIRPDPIVAGIGIWGLLVSIFRVDIIRNAAASDADYRSLWMLPLTPDRIFGYLITSIVFGLVCLFFEFLCAYGIVAFSHGMSISSLVMCLPCAASQALFSFALTLLLLRLKIRAEWLILPVFIFYFIHLGALQTFPDNASRLTIFDYYNPMGWISVGDLDGWIRRNHQVWWLLVPAFAVLATLPSSFRAFRRMHHQGAFRKVPVFRVSSFSERTPTTPPPPSDPAELRRQILSADFLQPLPWNERGPLERLLSLVLRPNEIAIAKSLIISPPVWTKRFFVFILCLLSIWVGNSLVHLRSLNDLEWHGALLLNGAGFVFAIRCSFTLFSWPTYLFFLRLLPLRGFELWKVVAKVNGLILTLILPLALLSPFSPVIVPMQRGGGTGIGFLAKAIILIACCSFTGIWTLAIHRLGSFNRWMSLSVVCLAIFALPLLGFCWVMRFQPTPDFALAPLFVLGPLGWSYLCGTLELKAWRQKGSKCAEQSSAK